MGSLAHLPWGTCPREGPGPWWGLQQDEPCPFSGAGLVLKQKLNLIHCQCSFRRNAAFTAEEADAISLPPDSIRPAHHQRSPHPPQKAGFARLSLADAARHPAASQSPCTTAPPWLYTQLHPDFQPALAQGGFGAATGTLLPLPGVSALCLALAERAGMTFPKGLNKPLGHREIEGRGGVTAPSLPQSHSAPRLQAPGVRAATTQCLPNPALLGWIFKIGL